MMNKSNIYMNLDFDITNMNVLMLAKLFNFTTV